MDAPAAIKQMWSVCDKPERLRTFHKIASELGIDDATLFWSNFWSIWTTSENLHEEEYYIRALIAYGEKLGCSTLGLEDEDREALGAMPDMLTVYRGCIEPNRDGWSWTLDRAKAKWFARRAYCEDSDDRFVLTARAPKNKVIGYLTGRDESEIVIHAEDLLDIEVEEIFQEASMKHSGLAYLIHAGKLNDFINDDETSKARAFMVASTMQPPYDATLADIDRVLAFMTWVGLSSRRTYFEELARILREWQNDPTQRPDLGKREGFAI